jgi:hypothetical protein
MMGHVGHAFYIKALTSRPSFWIATASSYLFSFKDLTAQKGGFAAALKDLANGHNRVWSGDKEFWAYVHWAQETGSLQPSLIISSMICNACSFLSDSS